MRRGFGSRRQASACSIGGVGALPAVHRVRLEWRTIAKWRGQKEALLVAEEMQDREIEHLRVLQQGEMAHVRQDEEACGMVAAIYSVCSRLIASSWSPSTTRTGVSIAASSAPVQFGWSPHILLI